MARPPGTSLLPHTLAQTQKAFSASSLSQGRSTFLQTSRQGENPAKATCLHCLPCEQGPRGAAPKGPGLIQLDETLMVLQGDASGHS